MSEDPKFESWCIVEVMGHHRFSGMVTEQQIGGASFIRVDVPKIEGRPGFTKLLAPSAIFASTPCTELTAREAAKHFHSRPFQMFELPMLPSTIDGDYDGDDEDF